MNTKEITFIDNLSTRQAIDYTLRLEWRIVKNIAGAINSLVHRCPWAVLFVVVATAVTTSAVEIGQARAERDSYNQKMVQMEEVIQTYEAGHSGKEAHQ